MNTINYINDNFLSIRVENLNFFLQNNLKLFFLEFDNIYLWVSNREYNNDYEIKIIRKIHEYSEERFIFKIDKNDDYYKIINDIGVMFDEFQMWNLIFTNTQISNFDKIDYDSYGNNECHFFKSIESDVIWVKGIKSQLLKIR